MRFLGVLLMAGGLLGMMTGTDAGQTAKSGAPRPNAMKTEAPSNNPLDAVMDDIYRRESAGQITHDQAMEIYGNAVTKFLQTNPDIVREHNANMEKRR